MNESHARASTAPTLAGRAGISERGAQTLLDGLPGLGHMALEEGTFNGTHQGVLTVPAVSTDHVQVIRSATASAACSTSRSTGC